MITTSEGRPSPRRAVIALVAGMVGLSLLAPAQGATAGDTSGAPDRRLVLSVPAGVSLEATAELVRRSGGEVVDQFRNVRTLVVHLPEDAVLPPGVVAAEDRALSVSNSDTAATAAVSTVRATIGATDAAAGAGVTVAVVDTGVAPVGDLAGNIAGHVNTSGGADGDGYGHGTFMAGLVAGTGAASGGAYAGVAPAARVFDVQVADAAGDTSLSKVLAGLDAVAERRAVDPTLRVLNLSLSSGSPLPPSVDPLAIALEGLWRRGVVVVVSAGNDGPDRNTISSPGDSPVLLTVGSADEQKTGDRTDDTIADFSARGPGGQGTKPEIMAPGVSVVATRAPGSYADVNYPQARIGEHYFRGSGTSMSAAVTSGAVAALLSARPELTADQVKGVLINSAYGAAGFNDKFAAGFGGLDLGAALTAKASSAKPGKGTAVSQDGPSEQDADTWALFGRNWAAGDYEATGRNWAALSPQTQRWAARVWAVEVASQALVKAGEELERRSWAGRNWAGRNWAADQWLERAWAGRNWAGRNWAERAWEGRNWAGRNWADDEWAGRNWAGRNWAGRNWAGRNWADDEWAGRNWAGRNWAGRNWAGRNWADDEWAAWLFTGRNWATDVWGSNVWSATWGTTSP